MATAKTKGPGTKVSVVNQLESATQEWIATCRSPKLEVRGLNAGQTLDRITAMLRKHFQGEPFEVAEKIVLTPELQARIDDFRTKHELQKKLDEELEQVRLPLTRDLQKAGLMQKKAAEVVGLSPTWLANLSRQFDSDPNNRRSTK